jgi:hypothetical protein
MGGNANGSMYKHTLSLIQDRSQGSLAIINPISILNNTANIRIPRALSEEKSRWFRRVMVVIARDCLPTPKANKEKTERKVTRTNGRQREWEYVQAHFVPNSRPATTSTDLFLALALAMAFFSPCSAILTQSYGKSI